jgi:hypothetical protein
VIALPLLLGAMPWPLPDDVPWCGTGGEAATFLRERPPLAAPPPGPGVLPSQWSIARIGDLVVMRDVTGRQMDGGLDAAAMSDALDTLYRWFPDDYDFVTILTNQDASRTMGALAFYSPLANDVEGMGERTFSSGMTLQGALFMNAWQYWTGGSDTLTSAVFGQELGHRWGAYVHYDLDDGAGDRDDTLGRDASHWSYWLETSNSPMEGNAWADNGDGTFTLDAREEVAYSDLDLYLMGLVGPEDVAPFFLIRDPSGLSREAASAPEYYGSGNSQTAYGTDQPITVDDVIRAEGPRVPAVGDSPTAFTMLVVLVLGQDEAPDPARLEGVEGVRARFEEVWEEDTLELATLDTTPGDATLPAWEPAAYPAPTLVPRGAW